MNISRAQRDQYYDLVAPEAERHQQRMAYYALYTVPHRLLETDVSASIEPVSTSRIHILNDIIAQKVREWIIQNEHLSPLFTEENLLWSVRYDDKTNSLMFDKVPQLLVDLKEGKAAVTLFRPSDQVLVGMAEEMLSKQLCQWRVHTKTKGVTFSITCGHTLNTLTSCGGKWPIGDVVKALKDLTVTVPKHGTLNAGVEVDFREPLRFYENEYVTVEIFGIWGNDCD